MYGFNGQYPRAAHPRAAGRHDHGERHQPAQPADRRPLARHPAREPLRRRPGLTQDPIGPGETFQYRIHFPDAGLYWYHPHQHREDVQQDLGLYGNLQVEAADPAYFGPANREQVLMLDDLLVDAAGLAPFGRDRATHAMMGRFGNLLLVNGDPDYRLTVDRGEVVRFSS